MASLTARQVLAGLLAAQRGLIPPEELAKALVADSGLRERLGGAWADLTAEAERRLNQGVPPEAGGDFLLFVTPESRFEIGEHLAQSPETVTWQAHDRKLGRKVALQTLREGVPRDQEVANRFLRAAAVCGALKHPGIVPVYDVGVFADGRPFVVMPAVEGRTLAEASEDCFRASAPLKELLKRFVEACDAVEYAHSQGVIHRDIRPDNIILGPAGAVVVGWSAARRIDGFPEDPERVVGTPAYRSPEQARSENDRVGPLSDVYSLGATLYHLLTGHPPKRRTFVTQDLEAVAGELIPANEAEPDAPADLSAVCMKALAAKPSGRYVSARALGEEVERRLADQPVQAQEETAWDIGRRWVKRHPGRVVALVLSLLMASLLALAGVNHLRTEDRLQTLEWEQANTEDTLKTVQHQRGVALYELANMHNEAGGLLLKAGEPEDARKQFEKARAIFVDLLAEDPTCGASQTGVAATYNNVGHLERQLGKSDEARRNYNRARVTLLALLAQGPYSHSLNAEMARTYAGLISIETTDARRAGWRIKQVEHLIRSGDYPLATEHVAEVGKERLTAVQQYEFACVLGRGAQYIANELYCPLPLREKNAEAWSRQSIDLLRAAHRAGYFRDERRIDALKQDADWFDLCDRDDFKCLLADIEAGRK